MEQPEKVLLEFISQMNLWEKSASKAQREVKDTPEPDSYFPTIQKSLDAIFERYCTRKERPLGRQGSFCSPPEYDPEQEEMENVEKVSNKRVEIQTQRNSGFFEKRLYVLIRKKDQWLIDHVKTIGEDGATERGIL